MPDALAVKLIASLLAWSLTSTAAAFVGLWRLPRPYWKSFWQTAGCFGILIGAIALLVLLRSPMRNAAPLLRLCAAFDGLLLACGAILCTRPSLRWSGTGLALVVQAAFLLLHNLYFWQRAF